MVAAGDNHPGRRQRDRQALHAGPIRPRPHQLQNKASNRLGLACVLVTLRYPCRPLADGEILPLRCPPVLAFQPFAEHLDIAMGGFKQSGHDVENSGFATACRADNGDEFGFLHG